MKTIQVRWTSNSSPLHSNPYYSPNPSFAWFGRKDGSAYQQTSGWHSCRETFTNELRWLFGVAGPLSSPYTKMTVRQARVLMKFKSEKQKGPKGFKAREVEVTKWAKESVRLLNIFEKYMGWPLTRLYRVSNKTLNRRYLSSSHVIIFALMSSGKWMKASPLMSLYLLIARLGRFHAVTKTAFKSMKDIDALATAISKPSSEGQAVKDIQFFKEVKPHILTILDNRRKLFFFRTPKENYSRNDGFTGISKLVKGKADIKLATRFDEAKAEAKKKG